MTPHGEQPDTTPPNSEPPEIEPPPRSFRYRLAEALGRPPARELTEEQKRALDAKFARADAEAERLYGPPLPEEAWLK